MRWWWPIKPENWNPRARSYACSVCKWQGTEDPTEPGDGTLCPECGCLVYPKSWGETWGTVLLIIATVLVVVAAAAYF